MKNGLNRRGFLKATARGAAMAGIAGVAGKIPIPVALAAETAETDPSAWVSSLIRDFTATSPLNSLMNPSNEKAWDEPLVGFSRGDDPLYELYKEKVGPFHWTPLEIFQRTFPGTSAEAGELTVISWILPQTEATKDDLRKLTGVIPAERWVRSRIFGEDFNDKLRKHVVETLTKAGHSAVAPALSPDFKTQRSDLYTLASTFSERHAAYAAGLGTFGLCDGLITAKGKAHRCGSVVARIQIAPTPRPYDDHHAYCLFYAKGTCGVCMMRCPVGAITKSGHDKTVCQKQLRFTTQYAEEHWDLHDYGCGFCQTGTPCESGIPV